MYLNLWKPRILWHQPLGCWVIVAAPGKLGVVELKRLTQARHFVKYLNNQRKT